MSERLPKVPWRDLTPTVLIPNALHGAAQGVAVPAIPLAAVALTGSTAVAAAVAATMILGQVLLALPAGWLVARFGERPAMLGSAAASGLGGLGAYLGSSILALTVSVFLIGSGVTVFTMARHAWITVTVPGRVRGRSLSVVAGSTRLGMFAGPFLAAATFHVTGDVQSGFLAVAVLAVLLAVIVAVAPFRDGDGAAGESGRVGDPGAAGESGSAGESGAAGGAGVPGDPGGAGDADPPPRVLRTLWDRRDVLLSLGLTVSIITTLRTTRRLLVPLVGAAVGLDAVTIALVVGIAAGIDFSLFYLGGVITDRWGRLAVALPTLAGFGVSHLGLALATLLPGGQTWYLASTFVMAMANGISSGIVATFGSDLAPPRSPAPFLSSWRLVTDLGASVAPFGVAALAGLLSLPVACAALMGLAALGVVLLPRQVRRYLPGSH